MKCQMVALNDSIQCVSHTFHNMDCFGFNELYWTNWLFFITSSICVLIKNVWPYDDDTLIFPFELENGPGFWIKLVDWIILSFVAVENIKRNVTDNNKRNIFQIFLICFNKKKTEKSVDAKWITPVWSLLCFIMAQNESFPIFQSPFCHWIPFFFLFS